MFGVRSTAAEVVGDRDLSGRRYFVSGCNTGIGIEVVRALFNAGATVTMACRNADKMSTAKSLVESGGGNGTIETVVLDLGKQASVRQCATEFLSWRGPTGDPLLIDTLICNGGVMGYSKTKTETEDGFEATMAINHYGHFTLTMLLLPRITRRVVVVASTAHQFFNRQLDVHDLNFVSIAYDEQLAYRQSKLCNILFAKELNHRLASSESSSVEVFCLHPGVIVTELLRYSETTRHILTSYENKTPPQGAATSVFAALHESLDGMGGTYLIDCAPATPSNAARNRDFQRGLFEESEKATGVQFADE